MKTTPLNDRSPRSGLQVTPTGSTDIQALEHAAVIAAFEGAGVLVFRGFELAPGDLRRFTDRFTEAYAPDATRRADRFGERVVRNVDAGSGKVALHSEASFGATWPEIVWFYCNVASLSGGHTTLCDGVTLWSGLCAETRRRFTAMPLRYDLELVTRRAVPGGRIAPWPFDSVGVSGYIDNARGLICISVVRSAVSESRLPRKAPTDSNLAFANHLLVGAHDSLIKQVCFADGSPIEASLYDEITLVSDELTFDLQWEARDLVMIDNRRFMHGRRGFSEGDPRDIVQVQSARASFGVGVTTRTAIDAGAAVDAGGVIART